MFAAPLFAFMSFLSQLSDILKFGVDKLLLSDESSVQEVKLEKILGPSRYGQWVDDEDFTPLKEEEEEENRSDSDGQSKFSYTIYFKIPNHCAAFAPSWDMISKHTYFH